MPPTTYPVDVISPIDYLAELFADEGSRSYLGEDVSIATHMLQAAALAERAQAAETLVAAALLHDVGHFTAIARRTVAGGPGLESADYRHQESGAAWLAQWLPAEVTEPVRLHVQAKRYLCAAEPAYLNRLSPASVHTLALQGGALTEAEARAFEALPHAQAAMSLRRWDDAAKDPLATTRTFESYRPLLSRLQRP